jgi:hypothetical protein
MGVTRPITKSQRKLSTLFVQIK